ncbi:hypothetical protein NL676_023016 [Syzygium grande]|nr:hypothetical protein NL676_023016 [Syzygium grande]
MPKKAVLMDTTGRSWPIGIAEVGNKLFIKSGWRDFIINHPLDFADFLIFRYNRDSVFLVKVFGKNGCRKEATYRVNRQSAVVKTEELADEIPETYIVDQLPFDLSIWLRGEGRGLELNYWNV